MAPEIMPLLFHQGCPPHTWETPTSGGHPQATEPGDGTPCKGGTRSHLMLTGTIITSRLKASTDMALLQMTPRPGLQAWPIASSGSGQNTALSPLLPAWASLFSTNAPHLVGGSPPRGCHPHLAPLVQPRLLRVLSPTHSGSPGQAPSHSGLRCLQGSSAIWDPRLSAGPQ